jgi:uncharacterized membrane protein YedE/YeeE
MARAEPTAIVVPGARRNVPPCAMMRVMTLDGMHFTPATATAGGLLIGLAAALLVLLAGRIAGISGIVGGLLRPSRGDVAWRVAFLAGLLAAPVLWSAVAAPPELRIEAGDAALVVAGLLTGVGTRYGGGCTSGHGVCGIARLSRRSMVATLVFVAAGCATTFVLRHVVGA